MSTSENPARRGRDPGEQGKAIRLIEQRACDRRGKAFIPRTGYGGSAQRFCDADCRLSFHTERLRSQRTGAYARKRQQPATQQPAPSLTPFEQAEWLIAKLTLDERRRVIERLMLPACSRHRPLSSRNSGAAAARAKAATTG